MAFSKKSLALGLAGILTVVATTPSFAQRWEPWAAGAAGFAAGATIGTAAATARAYGPGGYAYGYAPAYSAYAYQPETYGSGSYAYPGNYYGTGQYGHYDSGFKDCATDGQYNRTDYSAC
jgi:hypothetical protein